MFAADLEGAGDGASKMQGELVVHPGLRQGVSTVPRALRAPSSFGRYIFAGWMKLLRRRGQQLAGTAWHGTAEQPGPSGMPRACGEPGDGVCQLRYQVEPRRSAVCWRERESAGLGALFILVKLSFLWEIGGRGGPPDKGLL